MAEGALGADEAIIPAVKQEIAERGEVWCGRTHGGGHHKTGASMGLGWRAGSEIITLAETFGVAIVVHCSRNEIVHRYGERGEEEWLYFGQTREHYEAMRPVDGDLLVVSDGDESGLRMRC